MATWPAELKPQACYLYGGGLGSALVAAAIERGWTVEPSPHIAFRTASAARRLYMRLSSDKALDYVACWEDEDALSRIGGNYARGAVEHELWPWLKQRGFADDGDDAVLLRFLDEFLGNWPANMRPGLRFRRVWTPAEAAELGSALAETIRSQFDAVFAVAHEPALQDRKALASAPYRQAQVTDLPGSRDPFSVDPALVERGLRGRRSLLPLTRRQEIRPHRPPLRRHRDPGGPAYHQRRRPLICPTRVTFRLATGPCTPRGSHPAGADRAMRAYRSRTVLMTPGGGNGWAARARRSPARHAPGWPRRTGVTVPASARAADGPGRR